MSASLNLLFLALVSGFLLSLSVSQLFRYLQETVDLERNPGPRVLMVGMMLLAAPHILFATAQKMAQLREWPGEYVVAAMVFSVIWALLLGFLFIAIVSGTWVGLA